MSMNRRSLFKILAGIVPASLGVGFLRAGNKPISPRKLVIDDRLDVVIPPGFMLVNVTITHDLMSTSRTRTCYYIETEEKPVPVGAA